MSWLGGSKRPERPGDGGHECELVLARSQKMKHDYALARSAAYENENTLICGERGTGKQLVARMIHYASKRSDGPFLSVNCADVPAPLLRRELFGYLNPGYCSKAERTVGRSSPAGRGTLFIGQIGELTPDVQAKVARALDRAKGSEAGCRQATSRNVRIIASTSLSLDGQVARRALNRELVRHVGRIRIEIPPLRDRIEDIPLLSYHFLKEFAARVGKRVENISEDAMDFLQRHPWPGNVSELRNTIERSVLFAEERVVQRYDVSRWLCPSGLRNIGLPSWGPEDRIPTLEEMKVRYMREVLHLCGGNKHRAAKLLGVTPVTLWRRLGAG